MLRVTGVSQKALAEKMGRSAQHLNAVVTGHKALSPALAHKIERATGWKKDWLLTGLGPRMREEEAPYLAPGHPQQMISEQVILRQAFHCRQCLHEVRREAPTCPNCGAPLGWPMSPDLEDQPR